MLPDCSRLSGAGDFEALFGPTYVMGIYFHKLVRVPIAKDLASDMEEFSQFPVERRQVASSGSRAFEIAIFQVRHLGTIYVVTNAKIELRLPIDSPSVLGELAVRPALSEQIDIDPGV